MVGMAVREELHNMYIVQALRKALRRQIVEILTMGGNLLYSTFRNFVYRTSPYSLQKGNAMCVFSTVR